MMELAQIAVLVVNMFVGGNNVATLNNGASSIQQGSSSIIVVTDTMEQN